MPPLRCMFIGGGHLRLTMRERRPCLCGRARRANPVLPTASGSERYRHSVAICGRGRECEATLLVNPYDPESVGSARAGALDATGGAPQSSRRAFRILKINDAESWGERFLIALTRPVNLPGQMDFLKV